MRSPSKGGVGGHYRGVHNVHVLDARVVPKIVVTSECAFAVLTLILQLPPSAFISKLFPLTKHCRDPLGQGIALLFRHDKSWFVFGHLLLTFHKCCRPEGQPLNVNTLLLAILHVGNSATIGFAAERRIVFKRLRQPRRGSEQESTWSEWFLPITFDNIAGAIQHLGLAPPTYTCDERHSGFRAEWVMVAGTEYQQANYNLEEGPAR